MRTIKLAIPLLIALTVSVFLAGCPASREVHDATDESAADTENIFQLNRPDWSDITSDEVWNNLPTIYDSEGAEAALLYIDKAMASGIITPDEGNQVRAGFLYQLGRLDDAFLSLLPYQIDTDHPELLELRAEITWGMCRYIEAKSNYEMLLESEGDNPRASTLLALTRLYDDLRDFNKSDEMRKRLASVYHESPELLSLNISDAILSENPDRISSAIAEWKIATGSNESDDPVLVLAGSYETALKGDKQNARNMLRLFDTEYGLDLSVAERLFALDIELGDFNGFREDILRNLERLGGSGWLTASEEEWPESVENNIQTAAILSHAAALELGYNNIETAELLAVRIINFLNPYDISAALQLSAIKVFTEDLQSAFEILNETYRLAAPSDIRIRLRLLQYSRMENSETPVPWNSDAVAVELDEILDNRLERFPENAFFNAAAADLKAYRGDVAGALRMYENVCLFPGATREMHLRRAYYLARLQRPDDAWSVVSEHLPTLSPYMAWANTLASKALATNDSSLALLAVRVFEHLGHAVSAGDTSASE